MKLTINGRPSEVAHVLNSLEDDCYINVTVENNHPTKHHKRHYTRHTHKKLHSRRTPTATPKLAVGGPGSYWANMTPEQRRDEMARRRRVASSNSVVK